MPAALPTTATQRPHPAPRLVGTADPQATPATPSHRFDDDAAFGGAADVRLDRIRRARERLAAGHYDSPLVLHQVADRLAKVIDAQAAAGNAEPAADLCR